MSGKQPGDSNNDLPRPSPSAEKWLALIANHASDIVLLLKGDGTIAWASRPLKLWGTIEADAILGSSPWELLHPDDRAAAANALLSIIREGAMPDPAYLRLQCGDSYRWISALGRRVDDPDLPGEVVVTFRDVDSEMTARLALEASEARFRMLAENATDVIYTIDPAGVITWAAPSAKEILGYDPAELVGRKVRDLVHPEDFELNQQRPREAVANRVDRGQATLRFLDANGAWRWVGLTGRAIRDSSGALIGGIESLRDVSAEITVRRELEHAASHDPLTGLPNRTVLVTELEHTIRLNTGDGGCTAVVMLDLDHFKDVNDTLGHAAGDQLLCHAATRICSGVRGGDLVARQGGDEFVVVMRNVRGWEEALHTAERMVAAFREPVTIAGETIRATVSAGVSLGCGDTYADRLLAEADIALYSAKTSGRDRVARPAG